MTYINVIRDREIKYFVIIFNEIIEYIIRLRRLKKF